MAYTVISLLQVFAGGILIYYGCRIFSYHWHRLAGLRVIKDDLKNNRISLEEAQRRLKDLP